jgi:hypothetical protein
MGKIMKTTKTLKRTTCLLIAASMVAIQPGFVPTAAYAAQTPPPAVQTFIVFFDFDSSELTADASAVVANAVAEVQRTGRADINVVGHTDTSGAAAYNQALSERRAQAVKDEMVRLGLAANEIDTAGRGFTDPLVQTGPGVREPQNRRAVINLPAPPPPQQVAAAPPPPPPPPPAPLAPAGAAPEPGSFLGDVPLYYWVGAGIGLGALLFALDDDDDNPSVVPPTIPPIIPPVTPPPVTPPTTTTTTTTTTTAP